MLLMLIFIVICGVTFTKSLAICNNFRVINTIQHLIMSYFDTFLKTVDNKSEAITGTCYSMCPEEEVVKRTKLNLVHVLEVVNNERRLIKSYSRSAADKNMAVPRLLRPYSVLHTTVTYLLTEVTKRTDVPTSVVYDFVNDRLRAVRQDMTIQRLPPQDCARLLDPMVRFYAYYGHKLCELPMKDYDPVLNQKYLLECLKWCLHSFDAQDTSKRVKDDELAGFMSNLDIKSEKSIQCDRVLMESLYILCNLDDIHPLRRYLNLPKHLKSDPRLQLAYKLSIANLKRNYVAVCRMMERLGPLTYCTLVIYLPLLQRRALQVLSEAYSSKQLTVPLDVLARWLNAENVSHMADICKHYGVDLIERSARFNRLFKSDAPIMQPKKRYHLQEKLDLSIDHLFKK